MARNSTYNILMYSHDTYGLGHIRRTMAIASHLLGPRINILILTGSPIAGRFSFPEQIDFVRIPGMIKKTNDEYLPLSIKINVRHALDIRKNIITATAKTFQPHLFIVDKEPLGLKKEVLPTLQWLRRCRPDTRSILGLRDIMDDAESVKKDWQEKRVYQHLEQLYSEIWIYGIQDFYDPIKEYEISDAISRKMHFTGYIPRKIPGKDAVRHVKKELGLKQLWVKDESSNPTASFKDRASAILVARAKEIGAEVIVTASTGNAGAALAGMAAAVDQESVIFAPKTAPPAKIAQLLVYGARVILVDDNYDAAYKLSLEASEEFGWYNRNTGYNPFTAEGKKTAAYEIWEQVMLEHKLEQPLNVFVSVGDGNIISGIHKGFKDLFNIGQIKQMPRIFGCQSTGSAAIYNAYKSGTEEIIPVSATTLADSISVNLPSDGLRALRAATQTEGAYIAVEDQAILEAISDLGKVGIFAEPAGATALAGLKHAINDGLVKKDAPVLVLNTGSGLKDVKAAKQAAGEAPVIAPVLEEVKALLGS